MFKSTGVFDAALVSAMRSAQCPPLEAVNDVTISRAIAEVCGIRVTTREASVLVRRMVRQLRRDFEAGVLEGMSYDGRNLHAQELCASLSPVPEGPRYFAALGFASSHPAELRLPTDRLGLVFDGGTEEADGVDVDACAWRWVMVMLLTMAMRLLAFLAMTEPCIHDDPSDEPPAGDEPLCS